MKGRAVRWSFARGEAHRNAVCTAQVETQSCLHSAPLVPYAVVYGSNTAVAALKNRITKKRNRWLFFHRLSMLKAGNVLKICLE